MEENVDKLFAKCEKTIKPEKKELDDHPSVNHEGRGEYSPPSLSSSESSYCSSSHHSNRNHRNASKSPFSKMDVKFDLPTCSGESNAKMLNN